MCKPVEDSGGGIPNLKHCQDTCHGYRCGTKDGIYGCIEDDNDPGAFDSCDGRCQQYSCNANTSTCEIDDASDPKRTVYHNSKCSGHCAATPAPTPSTPCESNCECNHQNLRDLVKDPSSVGMTHHAQDSTKTYCYKFSLCGAIDEKDVPPGCRNGDVAIDKVAALRYKCRDTASSECLILGTDSTMSWAEDAHHDTEIIFAHNETNDCEKSLTVTLARPKQGLTPEYNPSDTVEDRCPAGDDTCQHECGWRVQWDALGAPAPAPTPPKSSDKGDKKSGFGVVAAVIGVLIVVVLGVVFFMRHKKIGPFAGGANLQDQLNEDKAALGGSDDLNQDERRTSW